MGESNRIKGSMQCVTLTLAFLHLSTQFSSSQPILHVDCNDNCSCVENTILDTFRSEITVKCSQDLEMLLYVKEYKRVKVKIKCKKPQVDLSVIEGLKINFTRANGAFDVSIKECHLPDLSLADILNSIGVTYVHSLFIISCNGNWQGNNFKKFNKTEHLIISKSQLGVLQSETFEGLKSLIKLKLISSHFNLTESLSHYTPKLKWVYLEPNYKTEVSLDVFKDLKDLTTLSISGHNNNYTTSVILNGSKEFRALHLKILTLNIVKIKILPQVVESENRLLSVPSIAVGLHIQKLGIRHSKKLKELVLTNITPATIQLNPGCFANLTNLKSIRVSDNHLKFLPEDSFSGSKNIEFMSLSNNLITDFEEYTFSELESLVTLDLSRNRISHIPRSLFAGAKSLKNLFLSDNLLEKLEPSVFSHLGALNRLYLSHNKLCNISNEQFSQLKSLEKIFLSHNQLHDISGEQFAQLKSLTVVDLSHNQLLSLLHDPLLSDLDQSVFYNCTQLRELHLQNNFLSEIYDDWRPRHNFNKLSLLNLSYNMITDIQTLDLTNDTISKRVTPEKITLVDLYLHAKVIHISYHTYTWHRNAVYIIDITDNPFNCSCDLLTALYNVSGYLTNAESTLLVNAMCVTPQALENVKLVDWTKEHKRCEKESAGKGCPEGCRCVYRPVTRSFVINCQHSDLLVQPPTLPVADPERAERTELTLFGNRLTDFRLPDDPGYRNISFLNLANNSLTTLDIHRVSMRLKKLDLSHNELKTLSEDTLELLENALELQRLELRGNPWTCNLSNYRLAKFISVKWNLIRHNVTCADGSSTATILSLFEKFEAQRRQAILYSLFGVTVVILTSLFILTMLYYHHRQKVRVYCYSSRWRLLRWIVSHPDLDDDNDKLYDAFIVFAQEDEEFVVDHLVPYLEETQERKYKLCLHFRDWIPGEQILSQIGRSVRSSRRTLVVLSPNFLRSVWAVAEFRVAHAQALRDGAARVIVILLDDVPDEDVDEELEAYLQTNTYVRWGSPWFWQQLTYALPHPPGRERGALHYFSRTQGVHTSQL